MSLSAGYTSPPAEMDPLRPHSVRILELQALRKARPNTAANRAMGSATRTMKPKKEADRARPRLVQIKKEDFYDERMTLKTKMNELTDENLRLKTRIKFLEKESKKGDEVGDSLVAVIKTQCKELKVKLEERDAAFRDLKQNIKATRVTEMQVELKAYVDECTRLRRMVEEGSEQLAMGVAPADLQQRYLQLLVDYKALSREYRMTSQSPEDPRGRKPSIKDQSSKSNATLFELREENIALKAKNRGLLSELNRLSQAVCPNCQQPLCFAQANEVPISRPIPLLFHMLWTRMRDVGFSIQVLWGKLDSGSTGFVSPQDIDSGFGHLGIPLTPPELSQLVSEFHPQQNGAIPYQNFEETLLKFSLSADTLPGPLLEALMQLAWQCQVARVRKEEVPSLLTNAADCAASDLLASLRQVPFSLSETSSEALCQYLMQGRDSQSSYVVSVWLEILLPDWQIFTEDEEAELDRALMNMFQGHGEEFLRLCEKRDKSGSQFITFSDFLEVCDALGVQVEGAVSCYLQVEFYSETKSVDKVPYQSIAQLYCRESRIAASGSA